MIIIIKKDIFQVSDTWNLKKKEINIKMQREQIGDQLLQAMHNATGKIQRWKSWISPLAIVDGITKTFVFVLVCSVITSQNFAGDQLVIGNRYHAFRNYGTYCINTIAVLAQLVQYNFSNRHIWCWLFQTTLVYFSHFCNNVEFVWQKMICVCLPKKNIFLNLD